MSVARAYACPMGAGKVSEMFVLTKVAVFCFVTMFTLSPVWSLTYTKPFDES